MRTLTVHFTGRMFQVVIRSPSQCRSKNPDRYNVLKWAASYCKACERSSLDHPFDKHFPSTTVEFQRVHCRLRLMPTCDIGAHRGSSAVVINCLHVVAARVSIRCRGRPRLRLCCTVHSPDRLLTSDLSFGPDHNASVCLICCCVSFSSAVLASLLLPAIVVIRSMLCSDSLRTSVNKRTPVVPSNTVMTAGRATKKAVNVVQ